MRFSIMLLWGLLAVVVPIGAAAGQQARRFDPALSADPALLRGGRAIPHSLPKPGDVWKPRPATPDNSLLGAIEQLQAARQDYLLLKSRGMVRPFYFHYKFFSSERGYFDSYQGFQLRRFMDGKLDFGVYKHRAYRGFMLGPTGTYFPSTSSRVEFVLRWNLNKH